MGLIDCSSDVCSSDLLAEHQPRLGPDRRLPRRVVARIDEGGGDAEARQGMDEDVVAAAIDVARGDDMAALPHQGDDSEMQGRSEEHTSELQSLMRISYAVFCLKKKKK